MTEKREYVPKEPTDVVLQRLLTYQNPHRQEYSVLIQELDRYNTSKIRRRRDQNSLAELEKMLTRSGLINTPGARETLERMRREKTPCQLTHRDVWKRLIEETPNLIDKLAPKLTGNPLFDLGGGIAEDLQRKDMDVFLQMANRCGASVYVDVDRFLIQDEEDENYFGKTGSVNPTKDMASDIERRRLQNKYPDTQIALVQADMLDFTSRLDENAGNFVINGIDRFVVPDQKYHTALARELIRTTKRGGIIMGVNSEVLKQLDPDVFQPIMNLTNTADGTSIPIIFEKVS